MGASLVVLGAGAILPQPGRGPSGYALVPEDGAAVTLFDCGPGSVRQLGAVGIALERVERVVLSHFHLDHCLDLFALAFARHNPRLEARPTLEVVGPPGLAAWIEAVPSALGRWAADPDARVVEVALDDEGRGAHRAGALWLECQANGHTRPALSWRATLADGSVLAYSGDTDDDPRVARLARDADLFVCECSFPDGAGTDNHLTPTQAGALAQAARARRLLLTHFYPGTDPETAREGAARRFAGPIELARDGSVHALVSSGIL